MVPGADRPPTLQTKGADSASTAPDPSHRALMVGMCGAVALSAGDLGLALLAEGVFCLEAVLTDGSSH